MRKPFKKSTTEEIAEMMKLYNQNLPLNEIAKRVGKDHTTILYWARRTNLYSPRKFIQYPFGQPEKEILTDNQIKEKVEEATEKITIIKTLPKTVIKRERIKQGLCRICGSIKDLKWKDTMYCGLKCFDISFKSVYYGTK